MANLSDVEHMQRKLEGSLAQKMVEFEERLKAATTPTNPTLIQLRDEFYMFKELVSSMLNLMQQRIQDCIYDIDAINMYSRRKALLFNGISETPREDLSQKLLSLLHNRMDLGDISDSSIKRCYRLGVQNNDRPRPVLAYFQHHQTKSKIWSLKSKLKGSSCSVAEFLTKLRQGLYRDARKHFGIKNVWSMDGNIYIKHPEGRAKVLSQEGLDALINKFPIAMSSSALVEASSALDGSKAVQSLSSHKQTSVNSHCEKVQHQQTSTGTQEYDAKRSRRLGSKK